MGKLTDADAGYNKGIALYKLGKYQEAITSYDKAIEIDPNYAKAWHNKGLALKKQGNHIEAEQCFKIAKELKK